MKRPGSFEILARDPGSAARRGRLHTAHGAVETPVFMPVGTQASVKSISPAELNDLDCRILLGNAYHLNDRPGVEIIQGAGGLHAFMGWDRAILTDSGGYQIFSLSSRNKISAKGVEFQSHTDGARHFLGPAEAMAIQRGLGSDIAMVLDECPPFPCSREYACQAVERTLAWAALCSEQPRAEGQLIFGIVQGSTHVDLRIRCAAELGGMGFDGYAVGGLSVGEPEDALFEVLDCAAPALPEDRPRYAMGLGMLPQMIEAIARGIDMFDCVIPTRYGRNGTAFTRMGRFPVKAGRYKADFRPIEEGCGCYACTRFSRAYIRHLLNVDEILGVRLLTMHNLYRYAECMAEIRQAVSDGVFEQYRRDFLRDYADGIAE